MPTSRRPYRVLRSVELFQAQDYGPRELVIVDDGDDGLEALLPADPRITYVRSPPGESIGAKRNRGIAHCRGSLVVHWDDDDWYAPHRLRVQARPLLAGEADVSALRCEIVYDVASGRYYAPTEELHRRLFAHDVHGGTLMYRRELWGQPAVYPDVSLAEDAAFLRTAVQHGARLATVPVSGCFLYVRYADSTWRLPATRGWVAVPPSCVTGASAVRGPLVSLHHANGRPSSIRRAVCRLLCSSDVPLARACRP